MAELTLAEEKDQAVRALVEKLDRVFKSEEYLGVFQIAQIHGCPYTGENVKAELDRVRTMFNL